MAVLAHVSWGLTGDVSTGPPGEAGKQTSSPLFRGPVSLLTGPSNH